jgi:nucleolar pre-ribosomal-associated protein 1
LLLRVCELRPRVAALYLPHATYSLDPRPSVAWLAAAALLGEVAANASLDPTPPRAPADAPGEAEGTAFVKAAMPASATRAGLAKGLAHASGLVRHATLCLLLRVLCAIRRRVARLDETAANAADAGNAAGRRTVRCARASRARRRARRAPRAAGAARRDLETKALAERRI